MAHAAVFEGNLVVAAALAENAAKSAWGKGVRRSAKRLHWQRFVRLRCGCQAGRCDTFDCRNRFPVARWPRSS